MTNGLANGADREFAAVGGQALGGDVRWRTCNSVPMVSRSASDPGTEPAESKAWNPNDSSDSGMLNTGCCLSVVRFGDFKLPLMGRDAWHTLRSGAHTFRMTRNFGAVESTMLNQQAQVLFECLMAALKGRKASYSKLLNLILDHPRCAFEF